MNSCEARKCRFWDGEKCNDKNDWITAEYKQPCCGLRSDAVLIEKEKRKPLPDGTLELTEEELIEFFSLTGRTNDGKYPIYFFKNVYIEDCYYIYADMSRRGENYEKDSGHILITNIKAILWLAERFELTSNN
jgi:hypothetical protein